MPRDHAVLNESPHLADLNERERRFVFAYIELGNASKAAIKAGYSEKTSRQIGARKLSEVNISDAIRIEAQKAAERVQITPEMVLAGLHEEATLKGEDSTQAGRVSAWSTLSKCLGMQTHKIEADVRGNIEATVTQQRVVELIDDRVPDPDA
ncbi:MAG: terminase small subunit [Pseudomonadota bacterium]